MQRNFLSDFIITIVIVLLWNLCDVQGRIVGRGTGRGEGRGGEERHQQITNIKAKKGDKHNKLQASGTSVLVVAKSPLKGETCDL